MSSVTGSAAAGQAAVQTERRRRWGFQAPDSALGRARERLAWMLIAPSLLVVILVAFYPLFETFRLSFTNERLGSVRPTRYVGFENYRQLFDDDLFISAFWHTVTFTVASVGFETVLGMIVALTINSHFQGRGVVRASMLVPWANPTVVSSRMWDWMYHDVYGVVNDILVNKLHILDEKVAWMAEAIASFGPVRERSDASSERMRSSLRRCVAASSAGFTLATGGFDDVNIDP